VEWAKWRFESGCPAIPREAASPVFDFGSQQPRAPFSSLWHNMGSDKDARSWASDSELVPRHQPI
jgi:hypothetical protein